VKIRWLLLGTLFLLFLAVFVLLLPPVQNRILRVVVHRITAGTGWKIEWRDLSINPWQGISIKKVFVTYSGTEVFQGDEIVISCGLTRNKPYIMVDRIFFKKPVFIGKLSKSGEFTFLPARKDKNAKGRFQGFSSFLNFVPSVLIHDGSFYVIQDGRVTTGVRNISVILNSNLNMNKGLLQLDIARLSASIRNPLLGTVSASGELELTGKGVSFKRVNLRMVPALMLSASGKYVFAERKGTLALDLHRVNPRHFRYLSPYLKRARTFAGGAEIDFSKEMVETDIQLWSGKRNRVELNMRVLKEPGDRGGFSFLGKLMADIREPLLQAKGHSSFHGKWHSLRDFRLDIEADLGSAVFMSNHKMSHLRFKARFFPDLLFLRVAGALADHGFVSGRLSGLASFRSSLTRHGAGDLASSIGFVKVNWNTLINWHDFSNLAFRGSLRGTCRERCLTTFDKWLIQAKAQASSRSISGNLGLIVKNGTLDGLFKVANLDLQKLSLIFHQLAGLKGALGTVVKFEGKLNNPVIDASGRISGFEFHNIRATAVDFEGISKGINREGTRKIRIEANGLGYSGYGEKINLSATLEQINSLLRFNILGKGVRLKSLHLKGKVNDIWSTPEITVEDGFFQWGSKERYHVSGNLRVGRRGYLLKNFDVKQVKGGFLTASGSLLSNKTFACRLDVDKFVIPGEILKFSSMRFSPFSLSGRIEAQTESGLLIWDADISVNNGSLVISDQNSKFSWNRITLSSCSTSEGITSFSFKIDTPVCNGKCMGSLKIPAHIAFKPSELGFRSFVIEKERPVVGSLVMEGIDLGDFKGIIHRQVSLHGTVSVDVDVSGTVVEPEIRGAGKIVDAGFALSDRAQYSISNINGSFELSNNGVTLTSLTARSLDGRIKATGFLPFAKGLRGAELSMTIEKLHVPKFYGIDGVVSGKSELLIKDNDVISLRGDFQTIKVVLDLDELSDAINKSFPEVEIVEDEGEGELVEESSSTVFERLDMDLNVDCSGGNAWVRGLGIETEVSGNIRVVKRPNDDLHLFGRIASKRGWYSFQSIRLKIVKGQVEFRGVYPPDPGLDIVGEKQVDEVVVRVEIKGRVTEPEFHLSGVPSMSEVDALSYLLFGRPARQLTARESVSMQEQAALLLGSKASRIFKELLGNTPFTPDILNFRRGESGSEVLEIGKYLTPDFYVTYEKDVTEGREDKVDIEYRVNRHISIQSQIGGSGNSGVDVLWRYDFGD